MAIDQHAENSRTPAINVGETSTPARSRTVRFLANVTKRMSKSSGSLIGGGAGADGGVVDEKDGHSRPKTTFGILADAQTDEVPGTVLLLSQTRNEPLGYDQMESHREDADVRSTRPKRQTLEQSQKRTPDGRIVLEPQPEESPNDPLNWPAWRRDAALFSLGFYCMLGGGMTPILAAGFNQVASTYAVSYANVALTTGLYMMGLGVGSVLFSPTAILWGKRPVYLVGAILFILSSVWCALAPSYAQLVVARIFQGIAVSPVECLPSSTIAEIFFLHERAFRIGIYTLLLLGGKNLIPLVSAAVIQSLGWRWVFWIVAIGVGFGGVLLFLFVPETFWDRTPRPRRKRTRSGSRSRTSFSSKVRGTLRPSFSKGTSERSRSRIMALMDETKAIDANAGSDVALTKPEATHIFDGSMPMRIPMSSGVHVNNDPGLPHLHNLNSPFYSELEKGDDYFAPQHAPIEDKPAANNMDGHLDESAILTPSEHDIASPTTMNHQPPASRGKIPDPRLTRYTTGLRDAPPQPWIKSLKPFNGRISSAKWWRVACRPFVLYAYPSVLWSSLVYALSVGWLIVLSESVAHIYANRATYNFSSIQTGMVYLSPFIGGVLGTAVAGRVSDVIVRFMARRNGGVYEPEFRLVMAIPITITTAIGLMGFGWSAEERDNFMVPTIFFGIISFGCCVGSTTSITFCVDSYRQFAGEALVTLNFSKNILHGLIWSLFFPAWLQDDGPKTVFLAIGGIQIACMLTTIPMYIYGKRARMWTVRKKMMERL